MYMGILGNEACDIITLEKLMITCGVSLLINQFFAQKIDGIERNHVVSIGHSFAICMDADIGAISFYNENTFINRLFPTHNVNRKNTTFAQF